MKRQEAWSLMRKAAAVTIVLVVLLLAMLLHGVTMGNRAVVVHGGWLHFHTLRPEDCSKYRVGLPRFTARAPLGLWPPCKTHLKDIGTALDMYSTDNGGHYPTSLSSLTPNYLKTIPRCRPCGLHPGEDTYSAGFTSASQPDAYTVVCSGLHHADVGQGLNYPQYTSSQGLIAQ